MRVWSLIQDVWISVSATRSTIAVHAVHTVVRLRAVATGTVMYGREAVLSRRVTTFSGPRRLTMIQTQIGYLDGA